MKKKIIISFALAIILAFTSVAVYAAPFDSGVGKDEIPYGEFGDENTAYRYKTFDMMTEDEARAAGVPEGFSGHVLKIVGEGSGVGIGLDLSEYRVKDIEKITFRVWCPKGTKSNGVRLTNTSSSSWMMLADPGKVEQWVDVVLDETSNFETSEKSFDAFDRGDGFCKTVNFCIRYDGGDGIAYIDSITVELKAPDTVAPVITYNGGNVIETTAGRELQINATAHDEYYGMDIEPEYIFSEGAVDKDGLLLEGEHSCTVRFTDPAGNFSELKLSLKVAPKDTTAPTLSWAPEKLYATEGMMPIIDVTATDDRDGEVEVVLTWSEGAIYRGKLCGGNHTLTVTAVDETGNKTEKVIPVTVTSEIPNV